MESGQIGEDSVMIVGSDVNHIKNVLRMKPGEKIRISEPAGENYFCEIAEIEDSFVRASILEKDETGTELPNRIYLFQGLPKNDKMELIIQKAVELGVYEIIPVAMKNCVVKLDAKSACIDQLNQLDSGFEKLYAQVAEELDQNREDYAKEIRDMQQCIRRVTDKSVKIQAQEARNKQLMKEKFSTVQKQATDVRKNSRAITGYYNSMKEW